MNFNAIIAVLELKGILTREEGEKLVEHLNNKPQSTVLADAVEQVKEFLSTATPKIATQVRTEAKKAAAQATEKVVKQAEKIAADVAETVAKEAANLDEATESDKTKASEASTKPVDSSPKK